MVFGSLHGPLLSLKYECKEGARYYIVECAGIANQRETTIVWDRLTGQPLHPAIVWSDTRTNHLLHKFMKR